MISSTTALCRHQFTRGSCKRGNPVMEDQKPHFIYNSLLSSLLLVCCTLEKQQSNQQLFFPKHCAALAGHPVHLLQEIRSACWPCSCSALHAAACFRRVSDCARWSGLHSPECVAPHTLWESHSVGVAEMGLWWMAAPLHQELLMAPGYP